MNILLSKLDVKGLIPQPCDHEAHLSVWMGLKSGISCRVNTPLLKPTISRREGLCMVAQVTLAWSCWNRCLGETGERKQMEEKQRFICLS